MKKWLMAVIFASLLALAACGGGNSGDKEEPADTGTDTEQPAEDDATNDDAAEDDATDDNATVDAEAAEEIYKRSCASCHAADLSGGVGPDLTATGADYSAEEIEDIINDGIGSMPGGLVDAEDAAVLANWLADMK